MWNLFESMCVMQIYAFFLYFGKATGKKKSSENGAISGEVELNDIIQFTSKSGDELNVTYSLESEEYATLVDSTLTINPDNLELTEGQMIEVSANIDDEITVKIYILIG